MNTAPLTTITYQVRGMTCEHCVAAVTAEVGGLDGVESVQVELGRLTVTSAAPLPAEAVAVAVEEAGYELGATL
jgi:copper ion binding protein